MAFPLAFVPKESWHKRPRSFGAPRDGGSRKHAGCDLYAPVGTPIFAVADGTVTQFREFYRDTFALVVDHGDFIVRYGEVLEGLPKGVKVGAKVKKGQRIASVGKLTGIAASMIHFEMYTGKGRGELTQPRGPFRRRSDLMDPTEQLDKWATEPLPKEA
jgi:murein DD-endopeptidase MepM/ murein hydrolase activator NlpD